MLQSIEAPIRLRVRGRKVRRPAVHIELLGVSADGSRIRARVRGELDLIGVEQAEPVLRDLQRQGARWITLDLSELTFVDGRGVSLLVRLSQDLEARGGRLAVDGARGIVVRLLRLTGLEHLTELVA
jgi:anti-sigma B factor antagonist